MNKKLREGTHKIGSGDFRVQIIRSGVLEDWKNRAMGNRLHRKRQMFFTAETQSAQRKPTDSLFDRGDEGGG